MQHANIKHSDQLVTAAASHFDFSTAGRVLVAMTTFARQQDGAWVCWPSKTTLAELAGVTARTVQTSIKQLAEAGLITVQTRLARSSIYHLNVPLIIKPSQTVINALAAMAAMPTTLAERVIQATSRLQTIREQYKQGRNTTTPPGEKPHFSTPKNGGDQPDLLNKDLVTNNKRSEQRAETAPAPASKRLNEKASAQSIAMRLTGAGLQIIELMAKLKELATAPATEAECVKVRRQLLAAKADHQTCVSNASAVGISLSEVSWYAGIRDQVSVALEQLDSLITPTHSQVAI